MTIPVAILGATGYAGEIALRVLLGHPVFSVVHIGSDRLPGTAMADAVPSFAGETDLILRPDTPEAIAASGAKAVVLAKKSVEVTKVVPALVQAGMRIVDIGSEFRLRDPAAYLKWYKEAHACPDIMAGATYGLSEIHGDDIRRAKVVGNPGCYATSILLPLIPLAAAGLIDRSAPIVAVGYSGISGAGKKFVESNNNLFYATNENLHAYKAVGHQHTGEIDQELSLAAGGPVHLSFVPHLAPITRGILSTITCRLRDGADAQAVLDAWRSRYAGRPFVRVRSNPQQVEVGNVAGTNCCDIACATDGRTLIITSALDNLVKGASGQAVQNLNLMFDLPEEAGLLRRGI